MCAQVSPRKCRVTDFFTVVILVLCEAFENILLEVITVVDSILNKPLEIRLQSYTTYCLSED